MATPVAGLTLPTLSADLPAGARVVFDGKTYAPGDSYVYAGDACKVLEFIDAAVTQIRSQFPALTWGAGADLSGWQLLCVQQALSDLRATLADAGLAPAFPAEPALTGDEGRPTAGVDADVDATRLGAPKAGIAVGGDGGLRPIGGIDPAVADPRPVAQQARDSLAPSSDSEIAASLLDAGVPTAELPARLEEVRRGDPAPGFAHPFRSEPAVAVACDGDPVDLFSGEFRLVATDFAIPGPGFDFRLERSYASGRPAFGPLGFNWDHCYNVYLRELSTGAVAVWTGRLHEQVFSPDPAGGFTPPRGVHARLERVMAPDGTVDHYLLTRSGGELLLFGIPAGWPDPIGRIPLVRIEDRCGNTQRLEYDASGRLAAVRDTLDRKISFAYGACGLLESVSDYAGRAVRYWHDGAIEHLVAVVSPSTPYAPDGLRTTYEYDAAAEHPALLHNITRVEDSAGRTVTENLFGAEPASAAFNRVVRQYQVGDRWDFDYLPLAWAPDADGAVNLPALQTTVRPPRRPPRVYTFGFLGNMLDARTRLAADGSYRIHAVAWRYNRHGTVIAARGPDGATTHYALDEDAPDPRDRGNVLSVALAAPPIAGPHPQRAMLGIEYTGRLQQVRRIRDEAGFETLFTYDYDLAAGGRGDLRRIRHPDATLPDGTVQAAEETYAHDAIGRVIKCVSAAGLTTRYSYDDSVAGCGQPATIDTGDPAAPDAARRQVSLTYDILGYLSTLTEGTAGGGRAVEWERDPLGKPLRMRLPLVAGLRGETGWHYGRDGRLRGIQAPDGRGGVVENDVDADPLTAIESIRHAAGSAVPRTWRVERDRVTLLPCRVTDPLGGTVEFQYDERGLLLRELDRRGTTEPSVMQRRYLRSGRLARETAPDGREIEYEYDPWGRLRTVRSPGPVAAGPITESRFFYTPTRDLLAAVETHGASSAAAGSVLLARTEWTYDECGRLTKETDGDGVRTRTYFRDPDGRIERIVDERGGVRSFGFDSAGRPWWEADPAGNRITASYNQLGDLESVTARDVETDGSTPTDHITRYTYDARGRVDSIADSAGNRSTVVYDDRGLPVRTMDPVGVAVEVDYDMHAEVVAARTLLANGAAVEMQWERDSLGRPTAFVDPDGRATRWSWDTASGRWQSCRSPDGAVVQREFDIMGRTVRETDANGGGVAYTYAADGLASRVDFTPGPAGPNAGLPAAPIRITRDGLGRAEDLTQGTDSVRFQYDMLGRINAELRSWAGAPTQVVARQNWDDLAGTCDMQYPDGRLDRLQFDTLGRLQSVSVVGGASLPGVPAAGVVLALWTYAGATRIRSRSLGNGCRTDVGYDIARRPLSISHRDGAGTIVESIEYLRDAAGRVRVVRRGAAAERVRVLIYDDLGRLRGARDLLNVPAAQLVAVTHEAATQAECDAGIAAADALAGANPARVLTFDYTDGDVPLKKTDSGVPAFQVDYTTDAAGRLQTISKAPAFAPAPVVHGMDGRRLADDRYSYVRDARGLVREIHDANTGALLLSLDYDPLGRVSGRRTPTAATRILYLGASAIEARDATSGGVIFQSTAGAHRHEGLLTVGAAAGSAQWAHSDASFTVGLITDAAGSALERIRFDPFGVARVFAPDDATPRANPASSLVFGGMTALDLQVGLYNAQARIYDPSIGGFLEPDPRGGAVGGGAGYAYAAQDPVGRIDPDGEIAPIIAALVIFGALSGASYSLWDAADHPEQYAGSFSWRALGNVFSGALIGGVSALAGEALLASVGMGSLATGTATAVGGAKTLTLAQSFVLSGTVSAVGGYFWRTGFQGLFPEQVDPPSAGTMTTDYVFGGTIGLAFRGLEAVAWNPFSRYGRKVLRTVAQEVSRRARAAVLETTGTLQTQVAAGTLRGGDMQGASEWWGLARANLNRAQGLLNTVAEVRVRRLHADELVDGEIGKKLESVVWRAPGHGQEVVFNPEVDVPLDSAWIQVKVSNSPGHAARFTQHQAIWTVAGAPSGGAIYYVEPGRGYAGVMRALYQLGVREVRPLLAYLRGTEPFPLPERGASGIYPAMLFGNRLSSWIGSGTGK